MIIAEGVAHRAHHARPASSHKLSFIEELMIKIRPDVRWPIVEMTAVGRGTLAVPAATEWTHVQFRRFAGCPICSLHLRQFVRRKAELDQRGITEMIVFASSPASLDEYASQFPFALIADPTREHYRRAGVERSARAMVHPKTWLAALRGLVTSGASMPEHVADANAIPADFLINAQGIVRACKYGRHADDQWSFEELLDLVDSDRRNRPPQTPEQTDGPSSGWGRSRTLD